MKINKMHDTSMLLVKSIDYCVEFHNNSHNPVLHYCDTGICVNNAKANKKEHNYA